MVLNSKIEIGKYGFPYVVSVNIEKSTRQLSNTAIVELPLAAVVENKQRVTIDKLIKRGDKVDIKLCYGEDDKLKSEFIGYVKEIEALEHTLKVHCEDNMYLLRTPLKNKGFKNTSLKEILTYIAGDFPISFEIPAVNFESFIIKNVTGLQALQKMKDAYGFVAFLTQKKELFVGLPYTYKTGDVKYDLTLNVVSSALKFKYADDIKYKIKAISILKDNKRIEVETGDEDGEQRTLYFRNIQNKSELEKLANSEIKRYKFDGYQGSLTAFGEPFAEFANSANIIDPNYPVYDGVYYVESVKVEFGQSGFRRIIELGIKL